MRQVAPKCGERKKFNGRYISCALEAGHRPDHINRSREYSWPKGESEVPHAEYLAPDHCPVCEKPFGKKPTSMFTPFRSARAIKLKVHTTCETTIRETVTASNRSEDW